MMEAQRPQTSALRAASGASMPTVRAHEHHVAVASLSLADGGVDALDAPVAAGEFDRRALSEIIVVKHDIA